MMTGSRVESALQATLAAPLGAMTCRTQFHYSRYTLCIYTTSNLIMHILLLYSQII